VTGAFPFSESRGHSIAAPGDAETLHLLMRLRSRGVGDTSVLRAFEAVPRAYFTPVAQRDLAARDLALPTGCGQTVGAPSDLALALASLDLRKDHRVLDIGTGSGYAAAVISHLAAQVVSVERFRTLAIEAKRRIEGCGIGNVRVVLADALAEVPVSGPFDRAFIDFAVDKPPSAVARQLSEGAVCVFPRPDGRMCHLVRAERLESGWREELVGLTRADPPILGLSRYI